MRNFHTLGCQNISFLFGFLSIFNSIREPFIVFAVFSHR